MKPTDKAYATSAMNFIKLIPILFLAHTPLSDGRPTGLQLLPEVPGYIPVYIQTGNEPPDVKSIILSMGKSVPKRETLIEKDPLKGEGQPEVPKDPFAQYGDKGPEKISDLEKKEEQSNDPLTPIEEKKTEKEMIVEKKAETKKPIGQIREIAHYEVKEPAQE